MRQPHYILKWGQKYHKSVAMLDWYWPVYKMARTCLQLSLRQWVLSSWKVNIAENPWGMQGSYSAIHSAQTSKHFNQKLCGTWNNLVLPNIAPHEATWKYNPALLCSLIMQNPLIMQKSLIMWIPTEWAKLDLQSIQHRDYFGHLSILHEFLNY